MLLDMAAVPLSRPMYNASSSVSRERLRLYAPCTARLHDNGGPSCEVPKRGLAQRMTGCPEVVMEPKSTAYDRRVMPFRSVPFFVMHLLPLLAIWTGVTWRTLALFGVLYVGRMFFVTAGYHRYFAHRSYRMGRVAQLVMAFGGTTAMQKGPLWWAGHHRLHHRFSDTARDVHSPQDGFWWSHGGGFLSARYKATEPDTIKDFARFPELRLLDRWWWLGPLALVVACYGYAGWGGVIVGFVWSTVALWHGTFIVNSLAHVYGRRRYATSDTSRNSWLIALVTNGEGWHNNHHHYPASARQGFYWWEWDLSWYGLRALGALRVVRDLKRPPAWALESGRLDAGQFDVGMFGTHWRKASEALENFARSSGELARAGGDLVAGARASASDAREALDARVEAARKALEELVDSSRQGAEELARAARQRQRQGLAGGRAGAG